MTKTHVPIVSIVSNYEPTPDENRAAPSETHVTNVPIISNHE